MNERVFVFAEDPDDRSAVVTALRQAEYVVATGSTTEVTLQPFPLELAQAVVAVVPSTPPGIDGMQAVWQARALGVPLMLIETPTSLPFTGPQIATITVRLSLRDLQPVVGFLRTMLEHTRASGEVSPAFEAGPVLGAEAAQFAASIRNAADESRLTRQAAMFLSRAGVELGVPDEPGPDFIGWSDSLGSVFGNPFLIEVKRFSEPLNDPHASSDQARRWILQSGVRTALFLLGSEYAEPSIGGTSEGGLVVELPLIELAEETEARSLHEAVLVLLRRTGAPL